jgi:DNA topoisomerase-1
VYAQKKSAQDAHEAIRPTTLDLPPERVEKYLSKEQWKLYTLIWDRFIASQMASALYDTLTVDIQAGDYGLRANGSKLKFPGFMVLYTESKEDKDAKDDKDTSLPDLAAGQQLKLQKVDLKQHFTEPPPRYTEASLVKILEEKGIGRPSTYAPIIETILARGYVVRSEKKFEPTELGFIVVDLLKQYFEDIVDVEFTAGMEGRLDAIAEGQGSRIELLRDFYKPFADDLAHAEEEIGHVELPVEVSDVKCEKCGRFMVIKQGRFGKFLGCPGFPECHNTKPIAKETGVPCPKCGGNILQLRTKRGRIFYGCQKYPDCDFKTWDEPLQEKCQACGAFMAKHSMKNRGFILQCSNEACLTRAKKSEEAAEPKKAKKASQKKAATAKSAAKTKKRPPKKSAEATS